MPPLTIGRAERGPSWIGSAVQSRHGVLAWYDSTKSESSTRPVPLLAVIFSLLFRRFRLRPWIISCHTRITEASHGLPQIDGRPLADTRCDPRHRGEVIEARSKAGIRSARWITR
jgi:hypothetical protein